jgi:uridine phosphorylase
LVVGDPARAKLIADSLDAPRLVATNREWVTYVGEWRGLDLVVASHGVGSGGALCLFQELIFAGVTTIVRFGTAGSLTRRIAVGDLVVAEAAVRDDGVTDQLIPAIYPAFGSPEVVLALEAAARDHNMKSHRGVTWTRGAFYDLKILPSMDDVYRKAGVIAVEMELAALLVVSAIHRVHCGGLLVIDGYAGEDAYDPYTEAVARSVAGGARVALDAMHSLTVQ